MTITNTQIFQERLKRLGYEIDQGFAQADNGDFVDPQALRQHLQSKDANTFNKPVSRLAQVRQ